MIPHVDAIILGSASPRRRELLERVGLVVSVSPADVDETVLPGETPCAYLERVVEAKLLAVRERVGEGRLVVVADTSVIRDEVLLGKPRDDVEATSMLAHLSGRRHRVATRFAVARGSSIIAETVNTEVEFRGLSEGEIARYVAAGEGRDKAGSYAIQGVGAAFVRRIEGSYTNVVGLPLCEVLEAIERVRAH